MLSVDYETIAPKHEAYETMKNTFIDFETEFSTTCSLEKLVKRALDGKIDVDWCDMREAINDEEVKMKFVHYVNYMIINYTPEKKFLNKSAYQKGGRNHWWLNDFSKGLEKWISKNISNYEDIYKLLEDISREFPRFEEKYNNFLMRHKDPNASFKQYLSVLRAFDDETDFIIVYEPIRKFVEFWRYIAFYYKAQDSPSLCELKEKVSDTAYKQIMSDVEEWFEDLKYHIREEIDEELERGEINDELADALYGGESEFRKVVESIIYQVGYGFMNDDEARVSFHWGC